MQERRKSGALAMELRLFCTNPPRWCFSVRHIVVFVVMVSIYCTHIIQNYFTNTYNRSITSMYMTCITLIHWKYIFPKQGTKAYAYRVSIRDVLWILEFHNLVKDISLLMWHTLRIFQRFRLFHLFVRSLLSLSLLSKCGCYGFAVWCNTMGCMNPVYSPWASYQIRKIAGCARAGNAGNVSPRHRRKPLVSAPDMHDGCPIMMENLDDLMMWKWCCERNPTNTDGFPSKGTVMRSFDVSLLLAWSRYWTNNGATGVLTHHNAHMISLQCDCSHTQVNGLNRGMVDMM